MTGLLGPVVPVAHGTAQVTRPGRASAARSHGFAGLLAGLGVPATDRPGIASVTAPAGLPPGPDPEAGHREARHRMAAMLEELERLQRDLLAGRVDRACLERLAGLAATVVVGEPRLAELAAEIALRAHVELARLDVAMRR